MKLPMPTNARARCGQMPLLSSNLPSLQALSKQGCAVDFVGGSSSVLVVGGRCLPSTATTTASGIGSSNLSVWDTMAPTASSCVGRLSNHQVS